MKIYGNFRKVVHMGNKELEVENTMNELPLYMDEKEGDLGIPTHKSLKCSHHITAGVKKANWIFGMIKWSVIQISF